MTGTARQSTCVAIAGRGILIEGPPGSGKSSLALALIDRGAVLVGDDSILLETQQGRLLAHPHPRTRGLLEVRNLGLLAFRCLDTVPVSLMLTLDGDAPRYIEAPDDVAIGSAVLPLVRLYPEASALPLRAELALKHYGLPL
ncbi:serine kinase [Novosphingobium resinovorum]|uniref:HPr kinase/phosphorylase n=1 Tax=Novosphingobium resinovorum TaxID=158500 RepID=UPI002ED03E18|nr:serine kinase [Novosphingobium resinovorum]